MTYEVQVSIPYFTGIPEDVIVNVWHFDWLGVGSPDATNHQTLRDALEVFYETVYATTGTFSMAPWCRPDLTKMKAFNLSDPSPRAPIYNVIEPMACLLAPSSTNIPEFALCMSYQAQRQSGVSQARRRGRIFLGGLGGWIAPGNSTTFPEIALGSRNQINLAATNLFNTIELTDWEWVVYSRTGINDGDLTPSSARVVGGWVDNAPDIQRRRGTNPSARTTWGVVVP